METLRLTHFLDVIKKEANPESEATSSTKNNETTLKMNIKDEYIKEEIDIPWDGISYIVDKGQDDIYLEKHMNIFNPQVIINKLPDSIVQKYFEGEIIKADNFENDNRKFNSSIIQKCCTKKTDTNFRNKVLRNNTDLNKIDKHYISDYFWKICTICNKKYEIIRHQRKMRNCIQCINRLNYECKICHKILFTYDGITSHVRLKCISNGFYHQCFQCDFKAVYKFNVKSHVKHKHPTMTSQMHRIKMIESNNVQNELRKTTIKCSKCEKNVDSLLRLMKHVQICTGKGGITNNENQEILEEVSESVSDDQMLICCQKCDKETAYSNETRKGDRCRRKKCSDCKTIMTFKCLECKRPYVSKYALICHIQCKHSSEQEFQEYKCPECDYKTSVLRNLCAHYKWTHTPQIHECTNCGKKYDKRSDMNRHLKQCELRWQYNCDQCSYKSYNRTHFLLHLQRRHSRPTEIDCPSCRLTFKNKICLKFHRTVCGKPPHLIYEDHSYAANCKSVLKEHKSRFHAEDKNISSVIGKSGKHCDVTFEKYRCDHCSYESTSRMNIYHHIVKNHLKEENIKCPRCSAEFCNNVYLDQHLQYCGVKPYLHCTHCAFKTFKRGLLNKHMKHHLNYECPKCKESFQRKVALRRHRQSNNCNGILKPEMI